jgi:hypothetical protein
MKTPQGFSRDNIRDSEISLKPPERKLHSGGFKSDLGTGP